MSAVRPVQGSFIEGMERPVGPLPLSVFAGSNADLMAAIADIYFSGSVLDTTYGNGETAGGWWKRFTPEPFVFHDLALDGVDFRQLPHDDDEFDTVCFDPPYVISGGESRTMPEFQNRYGIGGHNLRATNSAGGNRALHDLIREGLAECLRVSSKWLLVKCMEFAQGGGVNTGSGRDFHDMPYLVTKWALDLGYIKHDVIVHNTGPGPGGHNIWTVRRARRAHSYLLVFAPDSSGLNQPSVVDVNATGEAV